MAGIRSIEDRVIVALRRISRAIDLRSRVLLRQYGLTAPQLAALRVVGRFQPMTVGGVARAIHLSHATVTGICDRLERRGLLTRSRDQKDRRSVMVALTSEGERMLELAPPLLQDRFRQELGRLPEWEQTQILANLQRIAAMMDADAIEAVPLLGPDVGTVLLDDGAPALHEAGTPMDEETVGHRPGRTP